MSPRMFFVTHSFRLKSKLKKNSWRKTAQKYTGRKWYDDYSKYSSDEEWNSQVIMMEWRLQEDDKEIVEDNAAKGQK